MPTALLPNICKFAVMNRYAERIEQLRTLMMAKGWDAVILTGSDPHSSEYPAERWKQVEWMSGFTGEAGDLVITLNHAGLWTDTRYFIQAVSQLSGTGVELHRTRVPEQVLIPEWLEGQAAGNPEYTVAVDGLCFTSAQVAGLGDINVVSVPDMLNIFWKDRPLIPRTPVCQIEAGESRSEKIAWLRRALSESGCDAILLTALDDIAWMLNVRASDIEYNPLVISYLLVGQDVVNWYVLKDGDAGRVSEECFDSLSAEGITILPYPEISLLAGEDLPGVSTLWVDDSTLNLELDRMLAAMPVRIYRAESPVQLRKAVKNTFEIENLKAAHIRDGVAVERFLFWLENRLELGEVISERDASLKLGEYRAEIPDYRGDSFETISASGAGAALPHYITPRENAPYLPDHGLYLCDSGGQYLSGTTDITRTVPLGPCSALEKEDYTLVLKAHIDLAMAVFPAGTAGCQIDALAREALWRFKRNFGHGTGHGVGFFLGCHEGPQDIRQNFNRTAFLPGMVVSDEPGIYREGMHGVRHENLLLCVEEGSNDFGRWLAFEPLTLCHFDTRAIVRSLLGEDEIKWLNDYNEKVYRTLSPYLNKETGRWLRIRTEAI